MEGRRRGRKGYGEEAEEEEGVRVVGQAVDGIRGRSERLEVRWGGGGGDRRLRKMKRGRAERGVQEKRGELGGGRIIGKKVGRGGRWHVKEERT